MANIFDLVDSVVSALSGIETEEDTINSGLSELQSVQVLHARLHKARAFVGGLLNRHQLIHRLPVEILTHIFLLVSNHGLWDDSRDSLAWDLRSPGGRPRQLVPLTAVCQRWRSVLLETPLLWSTIEDSDDSYAIPSFTHYIHRCTCGPLYVDLDGYPDDVTWELVASHGERIQALSATGLAVSGDFPELIASLRADGLRRCHFDLFAHRYAGPPFQTFFRDGHAPQLRAMQLESSRYLPRNQFPALTHLHLNCPWNASYNCLDLLAFLSGCPSLQVLYIGTRSTSRRQAPDTTSVPSNSLHLRHLQKLSIVDLSESENSFDDDDFYRPTPEQIARFVANRSATQRTLLLSMVFPPQCLVYLSPVLSTDLQAFADRMSTLIEPSSMRIVDADENHFHPEDSERISLVLVQPAKAHGVRFDVQVKGCGLSLSTIRQGVHHAVAASPLFAGIRALWVDTGSVDFLCEPDSILWGLPRLEYLSICCGRQEERALERALQVLSEVQGGSVFCPELHTLVLTLPDRHLIAKLRDPVIQRRALGHPITRLALTVDLGHASWEAREGAQGLERLVEHYLLRDVGDGVGDSPESVWGCAWDERVPAGCRKADGSLEYHHGHWPAWVQQADPAVRVCITRPYI